MLPNESSLFRVILEEPKTASNSSFVILWSNTVSMSANLLVSFGFSKQSRAFVSYFSQILREIVEKRPGGQLPTRLIFVVERACVVVFG